MDRAMVLRVMVPVGGLSALILFVGIVIALSGGTEVGSVPSTSHNSNPGGLEKKTPNTPDTTPLGAIPGYQFPLEGREWNDVDPIRYPGLKYWDAKEGDGKPCPEGVNVSARYTGWTVDGKCFDSTKKSGNSPLNFSLRGVIAGWTSGLPGMKVNGVRRLYIPSRYGYGAKGNMGIPPNSDLVFEVELVNFH